METETKNDSESTKNLPSTANNEMTTDDNLNENSEYKPNIELNEDLRQKLNDFPELLEYVEKLQKIIQKQVKKIIKWKKKFKQLAEKSVCHISTQTQYDNECNGFEQNIESEGPDGTKAVGDEKNIADDIREAAEQAIQSSGFVYEETSGLYYDYNSGYYYNAEYGLYYDGTTGTYLKYNQETETYEFHSQITNSQTFPTETVNVNKTKRRSKQKNKAKDTKRLRKDGSDKELEEGECSDSSISSNEDSSVSNSSDLSKQWPPCMRMIVESTEIPKIKLGSLFIITCDGGTIGREGNHSICLPDINVSKHHLKVNYDTETSKYMIVDLGSRNGTIFNGKRISSSKQESEPVEVVHGSKIQIGSTTLMCHIHEGMQTCGHCEPGLLMEEEKDPPVVRGSSKSVNQQYKSELRRLRKQHGFLGSNEDTSKLGEGYTDRAQKRRNEVGSQNPYEKTETASVDQSISAENKGFKLLSKMGWKEGQSLGKDGTGVKEPVQVVSNVGTSGIGAPTAETSVPVTKKKSKQTIWKKTQERFDKLPSKPVFDEDSDS